MLDYIIISCVKSWKLYRRRISKIEGYEVRPANLDYDIRALRAKSELIIKRLVVFLPLKSTCFQRSLVIYRYYAKKGIKVDFVVGIRLVPYTFHCWLTYNGEIAFDSPPDSKYYQMKTVKISEYIGSLRH